MTTTRARWARTIRRTLAVASLTGGLIVGFAGSASAHAVLEHTSPASGAVLKTAPRQVTLTFGEDVGVDSQDVQVYDTHLHRVDLGDAGHITGHGETVGVRLPPGLPHGTYTVTWRVISADSHPVSGGFTYSVGAPSQVTGTISGLSGGSRTVGVLLGLMRLLGYFALIAGLGGLAFLWMWPGGRDDLWTQRIIAIGFVTGTISAEGLFLLQAPYSQGRSLSDLLDGGLLRAVAHSHFGQVLIVRLVLWVVVAIAVMLATFGIRIARPIALIGGVALITTWAGAGHGDVGHQVPLALASQTVHVLAVTVWMGGLLLLTARVLRLTDRRTVFEVLGRFSAVALWCVTAILITGFYQAWREVGLSWTALVTTTYGRLVAAKILGLAALIGLGAFARWSLGSVANDDPGTDRDAQSLHQRVVQAHLRQSVFLELELGIGILVLTSILVNTIPAKEAVDYTTTHTLAAPGLRVHTEIAPARTGSDTITITVFTPAGRPVPVDVGSGSLSLPARGIDSLPVSFTNVTGSNRATATTSFPLGGRWQLSFEVQSSPIDVTQFTTNFTIH